MLNKEFFINNRNKLFEKLENNSIAFIYSGSEIPQESNVNLFFPNSNYYYLTGLNEPDSLLILKKDTNGEIKSFLIIPEKNPNLEKWHGYKLSIEEASDKTGIKDVIYKNKSNELISQLAETNLTPYYDFTLQDYEKGWLEDIKPYYENFNDINPVIGELRLIKDQPEIEEIKKAAEISKKAIIEILKDLKPDQFEYEPASLFEYLVKRNGAQNLSFPTIAASGENGVILHYIKNNKKIKDGDLILFDLGAKLNGYCADISRTFPVNGKFNELQLKFYNALLETQKSLIKEYKAGVKLKDLQELTKQYLKENLIKNEIKPPENIEDWYYHSIGHSLGIDTHDSSNRDLILQDGMIITCEPGVYSKENNIGIRIEDDILINGDNPIILTQGIPKEINEIYYYMNRAEDKNE